MTAREAAKLLGCNIRHVNYLCRKGRIKAKKVPITTGQCVRQIWELDARSVKSYSKKPILFGGYPRGKKRNQADKEDGQKGK